jgi:hypothetical protein
VTNIDELMSRCSALEAERDQYRERCLSFASELSVVNMRLTEVHVRADAALQLPLHASVLADALWSIRDLAAQ